MRTRWILLLPVYLLLISLGRAAEQPAAGYDTWAGVERVIAVGDVHGDYDQLARVLLAAGAVNDKMDWIAGKAHLVQMGDIMDRGPDSRKAMDLLMKLETQAAEAGGAVHALLGNHEAMTMLGDHRFLTPEEIASFGGMDEFRKAFAPDGKYGKWLRGHNTVIKINDVLYVHGGLGSIHTDKSMAELNAAVRQNLAVGGKKGIAMSTAGPLWYRKLSEEKATEEKVAAELTKVLGKYGATRLVVGHTVSKSGIATRAGGRLIMIDVGMCRVYGGPPMCLVIEKDGYFKVSPGKKEAMELPAKAQ